MLLKFEIDKQHITRVDSERPVANSKNYLTAHFDFLSDEWQGVTKSVNFWHNGNAITVLLDEDGNTVVPWEVIKDGYFEVSCFGGDLITNDRARVLVLRSGYVDGEAPKPPTPSTYDTIVQNYNRLNNTVKTDGAGNRFLSDDGTYKTLEIESDFDNIDHPINYLDLIEGVPSYVTDLAPATYIVRTRGTLRNNTTQNAGFTLNVGVMVVIHSNGTATVFNGSVLIRLAQDTKSSEISSRSCYYKTGADIESYGYETTSNKATSITDSNKNSKTLYPSIDAVTKYIDRVLSNQ